MISGKYLILDTCYKFRILYTVSKISGFVF